MVYTPGQGPLTATQIFRMISLVLLAVTERALLEAGRMFPGLPEPTCSPE